MKEKDQGNNMGRENVLSPQDRNKLKKLHYGGYFVTN